MGIWELVWELSWEFPREGLGNYNYIYIYNLPTGGVSGATQIPKFPNSQRICECVGNWLFWEFEGAPKTDIGVSNPYLGSSGPGNLTPGKVQ